MTAPTFGEWFPIEKAPKDGSIIMVYPPTYKDDTSCAKWARGYWDRLDAWSDVRSKEQAPTHWMPRPPPPTSNNEPKDTP